MSLYQLSGKKNKQISEKGKNIFVCRAIKKNHVSSLHYLNSADLVHVTSSQECSWFSGQCNTCRTSGVFVSFDPVQSYISL